MKAGRVKPGMLVHFGAYWRVVIHPPESSPDGAYVMTSEGEIAFGVGEDCKAVRLTEAQVTALRNVDAGLVRRSWRAGGKPQWKIRDHWQPASAAPYDRVRDLGLIRQVGQTESVGLNHRQDFEASPSGRVLLDLLDKEG